MLFAEQKNSLGRSTSPQLLPHGVIHTLMNDLKDVYEEMSVRLPWDVTDGSEQSITWPRSAPGLSTATPSRIVSCQGEPASFFFFLAAISQEISVQVLRQRREEKGNSPHLKPQKGSNCGWLETM